MMDSTGKLKDTERDGITIPSTSTSAEDAAPAAIPIRRKMTEKNLRML
jgi:hypothetical protein